MVAKITQMKTECVPIGELFQKDEVVAKINDEAINHDSSLLLEVLKEHGVGKQTTKNIPFTFHFLYFSHAI